MEMTSRQQVVLAVIASLLTLCSGTVKPIKVRLVDHPPSGLWFFCVCLAVAVAVAVAIA